MVMLLLVVLLQLVAVMISVSVNEPAPALPQVTAIVLDVLLVVIVPLVMPQVYVCPEVLAVL